MKKILIIIATALIAMPAFSQIRAVKGHWCALGTSITWYNENVSASNGGFTKGYQTRELSERVLPDSLPLLN